MGIKSILCIFAGAESELGAVNAALGLAEIYSARVRFLHISPDYGSYATLYEDTMAIGLELTHALEKENKARLQHAKQYTASFCAHHHMPLDPQKYSIHHAYAQFSHQTGNVGAIVEQEGRASDIVVVSRDMEPDILFEQVISAALFNTGRPVLLLPPNYSPQPWRDKIIAIAWNKGMEAARAIFNTMPILERAEALYLLTARNHDNNSFHSNRTIMEYLFTHGLQPSCITIDKDHRNSDEVILEKAKDLHSDLLVMGAYGHSKWREMIFGGFTKHMLEKANIPLVLAH